MNARNQILQVAAAALLLGGLASAQGNYNDLGSGNYVWGLNADGSAASGEGASSYFHWTPGGGVVSIGGTPAGNGVGGQPKLSDDGLRICGTYLNPTSSLHELSLYDVTAGTWTPLGGIGGVSGTETSSGWGISGDGMSIVGLGWISAGGAHAVQWTQGGSLVDLGSTVPLRSSRANGTNVDGSVVVGWQDDSFGFRQGAVWVNGVQSLITLAGSGAALGEAQECSADGTWAVGGGVSASGQEPYRWSAATGGLKLGLLPGIFNPRSGATAISADGKRIVGYVRPFGSPAAFGKGFLWREDLGMVDLTTYLTLLGVPVPAGVTLALPLEISADGTAIAGITSQGRGFVVSGIPEPFDYYCTAQVNSQGCLPAIGASGVASVSSGMPFDITATNVLSNKPGILIYSTTGAGSIPYNGGTICLGAIRRTPGQNSGGSAACDGTFSMDFNAFMTGSGDPAFFAGAEVWAQYWSRDPAGTPPAITNLTNAVHFFVVS